MDKSEALFAEAERLVALPPAGREVLRRLTVLRSRLAKDAGLPAFRIMTNKQLLMLSERPPVAVADLETYPGVGRLLTKAYGPEILAAVREVGPGHLMATHG